MYQYGVIEGIDSHGAGGEGVDTDLAARQQDKRSARRGKRSEWARCAASSAAWRTMRTCSTLPKKTSAA